MLVARIAARAPGRAVAALRTSARPLFVSSGADTASYRVVDAAASTLLLNAGCSRLASTRPIIFDDEASAGSSTEMIKLLLAAGAGIYGLHSSVDCVQGPATGCDCKNLVRLRAGQGYPADWVEECHARVKGTQPTHGVGVAKYGVATTCKNYDLYPELFRPSDVKGGIRKSTTSGPSGNFCHAITPWPILKEIMTDAEQGYPRVENMFKVAFRHSDPLKTILPLKDDTDPQLKAKAHYKELLQALVFDKPLLAFDIERIKTPLTKAMRARNDPDGQVVANEATQLGAVVGRLRPDLGKGDVEVILNEGQAKPFGEPRVREIMTTTTSFRAHDVKRIWSFGTFPEYQLLGHLGLVERFRNFHAVLSIALGMNAAGQHRNGSYEAPCPIASSMPMIGQLVWCDHDAVVKDPHLTPYPHTAARCRLPSPDRVDDPTSTLQVMAMVATEGLKALGKRWTGVDAWLLGDDKATPPSFETHHVKWYDASEDNRKYAAKATEWPGVDPAKMKPKSRSGKRKKKDAPPPVPLSRYFGAAPPTAKLVLAGSGSCADPLDLSNSPSPPKRSRVEALDELE